jgi:hypothetical protein
LEGLEAAASACGGLGTPRAVAREVERWLGEKIAHERHAIQAAIDALGHSELGKLPRPFETGSAPSHPPSGQSLVRPIHGDEATMGAKPSTVYQKETPPKRTSIALLALGGLGLVAIGSLAALLVFMWMMPSSAEVAPRSSPAISPTISQPQVPLPAPDLGIQTTPQTPVPPQPIVQDEPDAPTPDRVHRRRNRHDNEQQAQQQQAQQPQQQQPTAAPDHGEPDDEPIVNPYRH